MILRAIVYFLMVYGNTVYAATESETAERAAVSPDANQEMVVLMVDKTKLRADLMTWPEDTAKAQNLISLRIAIGKNEGDKQVSGDNKTPEGIYFAQSFIDGGSLPAKYGPKAIPINFPNPFDSLAGKTGHGIWLHGVEQETRIGEAKVTEGCVAFFNADIMALTRWLRPYQAVVMIGSSNEQMNKKADLESLSRLARSWASAWAERNIEEYISHYASTFSFRGMNVKAFQNYKTRVFRGYRTMDVKITDFRVFTHDKYGMVVMNQDFNGDGHYQSKGRKVLYWTRDGDGGWKIINESFEKRRLEFTQLSMSDMTQFTAASPSAKYFTEARPANL